MAYELHLPPSAAALSASMRDIGYSLETAIADLVDNSISAGAHQVDIYCSPDGDEPTLAIVDDGIGMMHDEIIAAMRHGGVDRKAPRSCHDLGKFGLGLKTASFSQCRRLTVVSRKDGQLSAAEWNLDLVGSRDEWIVSVLDEGELVGLSFLEVLPVRGTLVLWRSLDRLFDDSQGRRRQEVVNEKLVAVEQHLGLVFHRFLAGEVQWHRKLQLSVNRHPVPAFDPFCRDHTATQCLPLERIRIEQHEVCLQAYILPHHSKLPAQKYDLYKDRSDFVANQGVYVYRNCRLIAWGGWFRLFPKSEATKLARIRVDFPSALDRWWTIDIKKSRAQPPRAVRNRLRQVLGKIIERSVHVHKVRGQRLVSNAAFPLWQRYADQTGIHYVLCNSHPLAQTLIQTLDNAGKAKLQLLFDAIAASLPVEMIYTDFAAEPKSVMPSGSVEEGITKRLGLLRSSLPKSQRSSPEVFRELARATHLFDSCWEDVENFINGWPR